MQQNKLASGRVRYFNLWKGYGFIAPEDPTDPDVWVHVSALEDFPEHVPYLAEGEEVQYLAEPADPAPDGSPRSRASLVRPGPDRLVGTVSDYGFQEGFGTIEVDDGSSYFLHHSNMLGGGLKDAEPGDQVSFLPGEGNGGSNGHLPSAHAVKLSDPRSQLYRFAEFPRDVKDWIEPLAELAEPEDWDFHHELKGTGGCKPVLRHYVERTFARLEEERDRGRNTIVEAEQDGTRVALFNTGLVTVEQEPVIAVFDENRKPESSSPWWWRGFFASSDRRISSIGQLPEPADFLSDIDELFIRPSDIEGMRVDFEHIVRDHLDRFPEHVRSNARTARLVLQGDLENLPDRLRRNYKAAVPQLYRGAVQILLPLDLGGERGKQDLALVVERTSSGFRANTVLGVDLAYRQSRLIARPDSEWLGQAWLENRPDELAAAA